MATRPYVKPWNLKYVEAFEDLSPSRSYSETPHPLTFSDIITYGKLIGINSQTDLLFFYRMLRECDRSYLKYHDEKAAAAAAAKKE